MRVVRLLAVTSWLQLKIRGRSAFDGLLSLLWPLSFSSVVFLMYRSVEAGGSALLSAAVGASVMGVWTATSTPAASSLQRERRQGTLELLVAAPRPLPLLIFPVTLSMAAVGGYSLITTLLWGRFVFGIDIAVRQPAAFVVAVLVMVLAIATLGFLLAITSVRYRTAWALGAGLEFPVWFLCGFLIPLSALPAWVRPISWLLAPTWGMAAIRDATEGRDPLPALATCLAVTAAYAVLGTLLARYLVNSARANATLALT